MAKTGQARLASLEAGSEPPGLPADSPAGEGDDDALILWMLGLTPEERLKVAQGFVDSIRALRDGRGT